MGANWPASYPPIPGPSPTPPPPPQRPARLTANDVPPVPTALRDYFAAIAWDRLLQDTLRNHVGRGLDPKVAAETARSAYLAADAMLAARANPNPEGVTR